MRVSTTLAALAAALPFTNAFWKGVNIGAKNPHGSCKTQADWEYAFRQIQNTPQDFTSVRLYASSDCNTLANAVPAAINTKTKILVGVWTEDAAHFAAEKQALLDAIKAHGHDWILAISVGSEDLYRKDTSASTLAGQIYDVRGMVRQQGVQAQVGHVDTWTAWVDSANYPVITASDFVGMDAYPYFQGTAIKRAADIFWEAVTATRNAVDDSHNSGKWVWVTETGWPVSGPQKGDAVASVQNAQTFWNEVACKAFQNVHTFWYGYQDYTANPSFGIFGSDRRTVYNLGC